jgi:hypothetical protein
MDRGIDGEIPETVAQRTERMRKTADLNFHAVQVSDNILCLCLLVDTCLCVLWTFSSTRIANFF